MRFRHIKNILDKLRGTIVFAFDIISEFNSDDYLRDMNQLGLDRHQKQSQEQDNGHTGESLQGWQDDRFKEVFI